MFVPGTVHDVVFASGSAFLGNKTYKQFAGRFQPVEVGVSIESTSQDMICLKKYLIFSILVCLKKLLKQVAAGSSYICRKGTEFPPQKYLENAQTCCTACSVCKALRASKSNSNAFVVRMTAKTTGGSVDAWGTKELGSSTLQASMRLETFLTFFFAIASGCSFVILCTHKNHHSTLETHWKPRNLGEWQKILNEMRCDSDSQLE